MQQIIVMQELLAKAKIFSAPLKNPIGPLKTP
jgi:hypothetical protein